jgi:hypothetical protein
VTNVIKNIFFEHLKDKDRLTVARFDEDVIKVLQPTKKGDVSE